MKYRTLVIVGVIVALLLPVSLLGSSATHQPYEPVDREYKIAHESTDAYAEMPTNPDTATSVDELSPEAQQVFQDLLKQPRTSERDPNGWQSQDINICADYMLVCDTYREAPEFPGTPEQGSYETVSTSTLEYNGEYYAARQIISYRGMDMGLGFAALLTILAFIIYSILLLWITYTRKESHPRAIFGFTALGLVLLVWPYISMLLNFEFAPFLIGAPGVILATIFLVFTYVKSKFGD